jgi:hypothetical protein
MRMRHIICSLNALKYFSTLSIKRHDFRKKLLNIKCMFRVSQGLFEIFFILRKNQRDMIENVYRYSGPILMKHEFSRHIFQKSSNIKFHENPSSGSRVVPYGRTDMTKLIVAFAILRKSLKTRKGYF